MNTLFILLLLASFVAAVILLIRFILNIFRPKKKKPKPKNLFVAIGIMFVAFVGSIVTSDTSNQTEPIEQPVKIEAKKLEKVEKKKEVVEKQPKEKPLTLEEQSKKFIDENLDGKTIQAFTSAFLALDDEKLKKMIVVGHADGQQFTDDFDLLGRKAVATGQIMSFTELSRNTYNDRGKKNGSVTFTRDDRFTIYMGDKNIEDFEKITYDNLIHKDQDINDFFLGVYPGEIVNFATIDLDEESTLTIGDTVTVEGVVSNYAVREDYANPEVIKDFLVVIDNAYILDNE